jgi:hypothetical protein
VATKSNNSSTSQQAWANYDFRTWDPGKVQAGAAVTITGAALRGLIASPEWATNLASGVFGVKKTVLPSITAYATALQQKMNSLNDDLAAATTAAQQQTSALQESIRATAAPPQPAADAPSYQVAAKVVDQTNKVGLPGVKIRVFDSRNPTATLASGTTDLAGNAVLKLTRDQIHKVAAPTANAKEASSVVIQVVSAGGKEIFSAQLCPKLNQTETVVAGVAGAQEFSSQLDLANSIAAQDQELLRTITTYVDSLKTQNAQAQRDLQQELQQVQAMIADMK